jgi:hypothetical protein
MKKRVSLFKKVMFERYYLNEADDDNIFSDEEDDEKPDDEKPDDEKPDDEKPDDENADDKDKTKSLTDEEKKEVAKSWAASQVTQTGGTEPDVSQSVLEPVLDQHLQRAAAASERAAERELARQINTMSDGWWRQGLSKLIFEAPSDAVSKFDVPTYAEHVSRLIFNYDKLLDIPFIIFNKAYNYIVSIYGNDVADQFKKTMKEQYVISFDEEKEVPTVYAVGARSSGGA